MEALSLSLGRRVFLPLAEKATLKNQAEHAQTGFILG